MVRIKHTRHTNTKYVFSQQWEFDAGRRVIDVPADEAFEAVELHDDLELVATDPPLPTDWEVLRSCATSVEDNGVDGNSSKNAILDWLDSLSPAERQEVLDSVDMA